MKNKPIIFLSLITVIASCARSPKPGREEVNLDMSAPVPEEVSIIAEAISEGNAELFASKVDYPLERPYPLRSIEDSLRMKEYFPVMVDDSIRNVVRNARRSDWTEAGWRGWTLDAGQYLWIDRKIYSYPYMSKAEKRLLNRAIDKDLATLPPYLRKGWIPVMALENADGTMVFRVDEKREGHEYRLLEYQNKPGDKIHSAKPKKEFHGEMRTEGTEQNRVFVFQNSSGERLTLQPDDTGEGLFLTRKEAAHDEQEMQVNKVYWNDLIDEAPDI